MTSARLTGIPNGGSTFHRWILDPATGKATDEPLDNLVTEFPSINDAHTGRVNRYSYAVAFPGAGLSGYSTIKFDTATGGRQLLHHGEDRMPGEAVFAPAAGGTAEGTYRGGIPGSSPDAVGRRVLFTGTDTLRVADGQLIEYWANADSLYFVQQLGMEKVPPLD